MGLNFNEKGRSSTFSRTNNSVGGAYLFGPNRQKASAFLHSRHSHLEQGQDYQKCILFLRPSEDPEGNVPTNSPLWREGSQAGFPDWGLAEARRWWSRLTEFSVSWSASYWHLHTSFPGHFFLLHPPTYLEIVMKRESWCHGFHQAHKEDPNAALNSKEHEAVGRQEFWFGFFLPGPWVLE